MPTPGYYFRDGGTTPPAEENPDSEFRRRITNAGPNTPKTPPQKPGNTAQQQQTPPGYASPARKATESFSSPRRESNDIARDRPITATPDSPLGQNTSTSHQLATEAPELTMPEGGMVQEAGKNEPNRTTNLGWQANGVDLLHKDKRKNMLVGGLPNEELWTLQMYHVKAVPQAPPGGLDLNIADEDEFSPDKLRANLERLYMTVIIGLISFGKHIARLRSWREKRRTAGFAAAYAIAWLLNCIVPMFLTIIILLISVPKSRNILFPPAPIALVDAKTGGVQKPKAGVLGSHDSVTGAPEKYKGEAVEQEASNLVTGIATVAISSAAGRHDQGAPDESGGSKALDGGAPDPTKMASAAADAATSASGGEPVAEHDKTKQPMEEAVWAKMRPAMHAVGDISDGWERFANALSPTPPFNPNKRLQFAAIFAPILLVSLFVKVQWVAKGGYFVVGFAFFSDPLMQRGIALLNEKIPDWPKYLQIRNTLLKGVPTNAQLTITLLRIGEANRAPLPPPPKSSEPPPDEPADIDKEAITEGGLDATHSEIEDVITVEDPPSGTEETPEKAKKKGGFGSKVMSAFRHTTAVGVETKLTADAVKATLGSGAAKQKLGVLPSKKKNHKKPTEGPIEFKSRYKGRKGAVYVDSSVSPASGNRPASPCVYFTTHLDQNEVVESMPKDPSWAVAITDIQEVKKVGGLGWKGRIVVGWATNREIKDGLEIMTKSGHTYRAMAMRERDELFNRIIAMGQQVWESY